MLCAVPAMLSAAALLFLHRVSEVTSLTEHLIAVVGSSLPMTIGDSTEEEETGLCLPSVLRSGSFREKIDLGMHRGAAAAQRSSDVLPLPQLRAL